VRALLAKDIGNLVQFDPVARDGRDPEGVHQLRVSARRLRSELHVVAPVVKRKALAELDTGLHWLGSTLGRQRDLDVCGDHPSLKTTAALKQLRRQRTSEQRRVTKDLGSKRYRDLFDLLDDARREPPLRRLATQPAYGVLMPGLRAAYANLIRNVSEIGLTPNNEDLHRIRIMAKQCRYTTTIASAFLGDDATQAASALAQVQTVLGDVHDRVVALEYLEGALDAQVTGTPPDTDAASIHAAIEWLNRSQEKLSTQWRGPLEEAREKSQRFLHVRSAPTSR
jgi:CHAD domain-containing protein